MSDRFEPTICFSDQPQIRADTADPIAFLQATPDDRRQWLQALGLGRYAPLLSHLANTPANIVGVARFITHPDRVKFPDLRGVDLSGLNLTGVNLIRAQLHQADLREAILCDADLLFANFSGADLTHADLRGATLNQTIWAAAIVNGCDLRGSHGLTPDQSHHLALQGAIVR
jgi:Pentapeptide repeats (8 copies)